MKAFTGVTSKKWVKGAAFAALSLISMSSWAGLYNDGKVFLTGGVMELEGAAGGGQSPWATITGYETRDGINGGVAYTYVNLPNYQVNFFGGAVGFYDRFELSYSRAFLTTNLSNVDTLGLLSEAVGIADDLGIRPHGSVLEMNTYGAKLRLFGDAVYTADSYLPQTAIGFFYKDGINENFVKTLNASKADDYEIYMAFTKVFFRVSTLLNATVRYTSSNQTGLTGFGSCDSDGDCKNKKEFRGEFSLAYLLQKNLAIGFEYAQHGDNIDGKTVGLTGVTNGSLGLPDGAIADTVDGAVQALVTGTPGLSNSLVQRESHGWWDPFVAYAPNKNFSVTVSYLILGDIAVARNQNGVYASFHVTF